MSKRKQSDFIDIKGIFTQYLRNWYWFLISIIICGLGAFVYSRMYPRESVVKSSILVSQGDGTASMLNGFGGLFGADPYVQDEIFVITSHSLLKTVTKDLGTNKIHFVKTGFLTKRFDYPDYPLTVEAPAALIDTLSATLGFTINVFNDGRLADITVKTKGKKIAVAEDVELPYTIKTDYGDFTVKKTSTYPEGEDLKSWVNLTGYDSAAEDLAERLTADIASRKSNVIQLEIISTNAEYGCDILNSVMAVYNQRGIEERNQRAMKTAEFIAERLDLVSTALNEAETDIERYKEGNHIVDVSAEAAINAQLKTEAERRLVGLETQHEILKMTLSFISNPEHRYDLIPATAGDLGASAATALETYNDLVLQRMTLLAGAKPNNRLVNEIEQQIDAIRENFVVSIKRALENNEVVIKDIRNQANLAIRKLGSVPTQEREFINLKRQQEVKQQLYVFLLEKSEETAMLIANAIPKGTVIDEAYVLKNPIGMGRLSLLIIAFIIGLFIPIIAIYLCNLLRTRMEGRADVDKHTGLPILGEICFDRSGEKLVVSNTSTSASAELFRMMRSNLQFILASPGDKVVMVTSSMSGEGKSYISTNLAAALALLGKKTVLVGMDIRKPQLANYLGISPTPGLTQYLSNEQMPLSEVLRPYDAVPGMDIIVAGPIPPNPGELMTSPRIAELISQLRESFDYIILDTAPVGMVSDSFNLTKYCDATVFVVRDKVTRLQDLRFLSDVSEDGRLRRVNVVINGTVTQKGYGYGYR